MNIICGALLVYLGFSLAISTYYTIDYYQSNQVLLSYKSKFRKVLILLSMCIVYTLGWPFILYRDLN